MAAQKNPGRVEIIAKGDVQRVGYRDVVEKIARKLKIKGFVENLKPYDVNIIAEGEKENLNEFIKRIKIRKYSIDVEELAVEFKPHTGEFEYFEIKRGDWKDELGERLDVAGTVLYGIRDTLVDMKGTQEEMKGTQEEMKGTQEEMKGTQEEMKGTQEEMKGTQEEMKGTQEEMNTKLDRIADNTEEIKAHTSRILNIEANTEEIKENTSELKSVPERISLLEEDMVQVKKAMALV